MSNPNSKIDYSILYDTFNGLAGYDIYKFAKELAGEEYTSDEKTVDYSIEASKAVEYFDKFGEHGDYVPYVGTANNQITEKLVANTPEQQKIADRMINKADEELTALTNSPKLGDYPGIQSYMEHVHGFIKDAKKGIDRWSIAVDMPGGYGLKGSPDWTDSKDPAHPKSIKEFDDMMTGMQYGKLYNAANNRIDAELEIRGKVLTADQQKDYRDLFIRYNNEMIEVYQHQMSEECKEKYSDFFQNYGQTVTGPRGNKQLINELREQNAALENGWDVTRLHDYNTMSSISRSCATAEDILDLYNDPALEKAQQLAKQLSELDPAGRKFNTLGDQDEYALQYQKTLNELLEETARPEVSKAINDIYKDVSKRNSEYSDACAKRNKQLKKRESDPGAAVDPEPVKPAVYNKAAAAVEQAAKNENDIAVMEGYSSEYYNASCDENRSDIERMAAQFAELGANTLIQLARQGKELSGNEAEMAKVALAVVTIYEKKMFNPKSKPDEDDYSAQLNRMANDSTFVRTVDISSEGIKKFFADGPEKSSARLIADYWNAKSDEAMMTRPQAQNELGKQNELENNNIKNTGTKNRSSLNLH